MFALAMLIAALACNGTEGILDPAEEVVDLQLTPGDVTLTVGSSVYLVATGWNSGGEPVEGDVTWSSSDPAIASVTEAGLVTALKAGDAFVEADFRGKGKAHGRQKQKSKVKVEDPPDPQIPPGEEPPSEVPPDTIPPPPTDTIPPPPTDTVPPPPTDTVPPPPTDTVPPPPTDTVPPPQDLGIPFGPSRMNIDLEYPFNSSLYYRVHPGDEEEELAELKASGYRGSLYIVGGRDRYKNPDGSFNPDMWKAELDKANVEVVQKYVDDGTLVSHYALDEPHARNAWDGEDVDPALVDEIACYAKQKWPNLPVLIRTHPGWAIREEGSTHQFQCVDIWVAQYSARKGPIDEYVAQNVADAAALGAQLYGALNPIGGGDGRSGVPAPYDPDEKFMMSAEEIREYGEAWMNAPIVGFSIWEWGWKTNDPYDWFWLQPEIWAAVQYLADMNP